MIALKTDSSPEIDILKIEPSFFPGIAPSYLETIQHTVRSLLPPSLFEKQLEKEAFFSHLNKLLPIAHYALEQFSQAHVLPITFLCPAEYTHGVGRYVTDMLTRWLVPGKQLLITGVLGLNFRFVAHPDTSFFLIQQVVLFSIPQDSQIAQKNLPHLIQEMRVHIMAVYHVRYITSLKSISHQHKNLLIQANLSSLLTPSNAWNQSLFDQFQEVLTKIHAEETIDQVKKNIFSLLASRPKVFDLEAFHEISQYSHFLREQSSSHPNSRYISRVIACHYLLKKVLQEKIQNLPRQRHYSFKILRGISSENPTQSLGILFGFNLLAQTEQFELPHLSEGMRNCSPALEIIPNSLIIDRRHEMIRFFYWEVTPKENKPFSLQEIKHLKNKLPQELLQQIETPVHPIFMPRNEEEVLRNTILLSKQIKYVRDLPQVSIHYDMQSEAYLIFTVILVRILKDSSPSLHQILQSIPHLKVEIDDIRKAGSLRKKYPKEAATLRITLDKTPFFRADNSIDLLRARQKVVTELTKAVGEFRDFNGGIILKQEEAFTHLRNALAPLCPETELLLENYFYSLRPSIMQTVYDTVILKEHFLLFQSLLSSKSKDPYGIESIFIEKHLLLFVKSLIPSFKESLFKAIDPFHIPSRSLTTASFEVGQSMFLGFILKTDKKEQAFYFEKKISRAMQKWEKNFLCSVS